MTTPETLVADLKQEVLNLEADLRQRIRLPEFEGDWKREYSAAIAGDRTAATFTVWADDRITQAAVSWVLTTVFIRFCEDNSLLDPVWICGPLRRRQEALDGQLAYFRANPEHTDREWVLHAVAHLAATPATSGLVDDQAMFHTVQPSGEAITRLLEFWRARDTKGDLVHDFADRNLDTRFLGDLYQDLSEHAKKTYALLQTPEFVEDFILDRTLDPAMADRSLEGFKLIDPACGSGHFLLGAFSRLLARWGVEAPALGTRERVQKALDAVWGIDLNPFAVSIAAFRLTVAALKAVDQTSLERAPGFTLHVLAGDSLWFSHDQDTLFLHRNDFAYSTEHKGPLVEALRLGQYDAVVANPPYITVKDAKLNAGYRERFNHLKGKYQLTAPFMELLFRLARRPSSGQPAGWVGQITSNAFMKREFGVPLIEDLLSHLDIKLIVDTSVAYIPGHGTPTAILVGRNQPPQSGDVRSVLGIRGEPKKPPLPEQGLVWSSIVEHFDDPGYSGHFISVSDIPRKNLLRHPWSLTGGGADIVLAAINNARSKSLSSVVESIGFAAITGEDAAFVSENGRKPSSWQRDNIEVRPYIEGQAVRDYRVSSEESVAFPYSQGVSTPGLPSSTTFWPLRTTLAAGLAFGKTRADHDVAVTDYILPNWPRLNARQLIVFAFVATHNQFALDSGGKVFTRTATVIKLPEDSNIDDHVQLVGVLNSSTACFWMKQNSYPKGGDPVGRDGARVSQQPWSDRYEFTGTILQDFPLPAALPLRRSRILDSLAQDLSRQQVSVLVESKTPTAELLRTADASQSSLRASMIAHQEELDWEMYKSYGLLDQALTCSSEPPEVRLGERAFEVVLARRIASGAEESAWFERHGSTPITEIPAHWPPDYQAVVRRRVEAIESVDAIRLLETPECKRRWVSEPFAAQAERAIREWLLRRLEIRSLWFSPQGHPRPRSVSELADSLSRDVELRSVLELWKGLRDVNMVDALTELLEPEAVPHLASYRLKDSGLRKFAEWQRAWELQRREDAGERVGPIPAPPRYAPADFRKQSYWSNRGRLDVPKERFILYPDAGRETDPTPLLGWAGWNHAQQSLALATIIQQRQSDGVADELLTPLVAGMAELQPWVEQWHKAIDQNFGVSPASFCAEQLRAHLQVLGLTRADLDLWRPTSPTRGRRARA